MNTDALVSVPGEATVLMNAPLPLPPPADKSRPPLVGEATVTTSRPKPGAARDRSRPLVPSAPESTASAAAPVSRPAKPGIPAALIVGGGLVAVLVAAGALAFVLWKNRGATQTEPSAAPTAEAVAPETTPSALAPMPKGFLRIETQPAGALVLVNGQSKGPAPLEFGDLPLGAYEVKVELKGYEPRIQALNLTEAEPRVDLKLALNRVGPVQVAAEVVSNPAGANVVIDGVNAGVTPLSGHRLKPGAHQVEVTKEGFEPWTGTLNAQAGKPARLDAQLKAAAKATPPPTPGPEAVDPAKVYANSTSDKDAPVDVIAKKTSGPSVSYAPRLRTGESVSVTLSFIVDEQGEVSDIRVMESGGKQLDDAAVQAVQKWKYTPATKQGIKVKVRHSFRQTYRAG
jgi:TonB family protein